MWLAKAIAPSARAFLLKSCSSLRRCTARAPDRSGWSVCRVCSPHRPSALLRVHTLNFTSQFQHTRRPRERFSRRVPSDHRMAVRRLGSVEVSVCMKRSIYRLGPVHRRPAVQAYTDGAAPRQHKPPAGRGPPLYCISSSVGHRRGLARNLAGPCLSPSAEKSLSAPKTPRASDGEHFRPLERPPHAVRARPPAILLAKRQGQTFDWPVLGRHAARARRSDAHILSLADLAARRSRSADSGRLAR